ncbi:large ribosomal subunit protein eL28z-like isoform X2 [Phragmites australis]|uniref:large ribosomal subunit protein eL28z-like isoform X2 n=1 Tax=Phragmites australis TaxID=29695 RepID=UPI002D7A07B7|nr:large ribosomal subunit protein eL28z-like isoform X2 [Phragmites australis]
MGVMEKLKIFVVKEPVVAASCLIAGFGTPPPPPPEQSEATPRHLHLRRKEMATVPGDLIWQIVRKNNSFLVKQFGNGNAKVQFTKEPNNLYNVHSYKHSGLANKKTVTIQPSGGKDTAVVLSTTKTKKQNAPAMLNHKSVMRKDFRKMAKAVKNQVSDNYYRPDLTKPALARLSSVYRSLQVAKSGVKKKNRQPTKL